METSGLSGFLEIYVLFQCLSFKEALSLAVFARVNMTEEKKLNKWAQKRLNFKVSNWEAIFKAGLFLSEIGIDNC